MFASLPPEVRGVRLPTGSMTLFATVRWEDANEIAYTSASGRGRSAELRGVRADDLRDRLIERAIVRGTDYRNLVLSADANQVLFTATVGLSELLLHRIEGAAPVELTSRPASAARVRHSPLGLPMMATRDGDLAACVVRPDSVMLYHFASRTSCRLATGCPGLLAFSRDGRELLCRRADSLSLAIVSLLDGSTRAQPWPTGVARRCGERHRRVGVPGRCGHRADANARTGDGPRACTRRRDDQRGLAGGAQTL